MKAGGTDPASPAVPSQSHRTASAVLFVLLAACLGTIGYWMLWAKLPAYDDEGYILLSARTYWAQGGLYDTVYSQYGPAFYVATDALQRALGGPLTHATARWMTLVLWVATALSCGAWVRRITGSLALPAFTVPAAFLFLYFMPDEPFHPGAWIIFLLAGSLYTLTRAMANERWNTAIALGGATGTILLLTKINVGVFYLAATAAWGALHADLPRGQTLIRVGAVAALIALSAALMKTLWGQPWVTVYLAVFGSGAVSLVVSVRGESQFRLHHAVRFLAAGAAAAGIILGLVMARGTTFHGLLEGVWLGPTRHSASYSYAVDWRPGTLVVAGLSLALCLAHRWLRNRFSVTAADRVIVGLRLTQTAGLVVAVLLLMQGRVIGAVFSYVAPLLWTWVTPLTAVAQPAWARLARSLLAFVLLLQFLHAFPIGGIQETWGTFLFFPLVAVGLAELRDWTLIRSKDAPRVRLTWQAAGGIVALLMVAKLGWTAQAMQRDYHTRLPLGLPGAEGLRLPEPQRTAYRILALNAIVHGDLLFSMPGMFSYNIWTDLPTPTAKNTTLWFTLLNPDEQRQAIAALEKAARPCLIIDESLLAITQAANVSVSGPLRDYLLESFSPVFRTEGSVFLVRKGRAIAPLNIGSVESLPPPASTTPDARRRLTLRIAGDARTISRLEASDMAQAQSPHTILDARNSTVTVAAIDSNGRLRQEPRVASWPLQVTGLHVLAIDFIASPSHAFPPDRTVFYLRGPAGEIVAEARLSE